MRYSDRLAVNQELTRALVSFQANKTLPFYRWFKFKEAFSSQLVDYTLAYLQPTTFFGRRLLDPFAGAGIALTTAAHAGWSATGIELLPVGIAATRARLYAETVDIKVFKSCIESLMQEGLNSCPDAKFRFPHLRITQGAFPPETEDSIAAYILFVNDIKDDTVRYLFWFACMCVLEDISFTRKDGQYLRWDSRSDRKLKSTFQKASVENFLSAITNKLILMLEDLRWRDHDCVQGSVHTIEGSCLDELPKMDDESFDLIVTSPPYCNRYDYTRTYALELAFLGYGEKEVKRLRQRLLSCTVENRSKRNQLRQSYDRLGQKSRFITAETAFMNQQALKEVLGILYDARRSGDLNNNNIPNMVENYFYEMNLVIHELKRLLSPGGRIVMVNDNVQYYGEEVPVDLILSDFAASSGLLVEHIWVLPKGKGNSSQQMGFHGRREMRKCVYVWSKPPQRGKDD